MRLADYLIREKLSDSEFAELIGVSRQAVHRYRTGVRCPDRATMVRVSTATAGVVTANDFFEDQSTPTPQPAGASV